MLSEAKCKHNCIIIIIINFWTKSFFMQNDNIIALLFSPFESIMLYYISTLLWVMKGSYFGFGSPQQQVDIHARLKNTFIFL